MAGSDGMTRGAEGFGPPPGYSQPGSSRTVRVHKPHHPGYPARLDLRASAVGCRPDGRLLHHRRSQRRRVLTARELRFYYRLSRTRRSGSPCSGAAGPMTRGRQHRQTTT